MSAVELRHGAASDVGLVREVNEDALLCAPPVFAVADGMGGHQGGDVASALVVEELGRLADRGYDPTRGAEEVSAVLTRAHDRIAEYARGQRAATSGAFHAGTTVVVALLVEDGAGPRWLLANLGDSRIYRVGGGRCEQVSVDHSVVQELLDAGLVTEAEARVHPERHVITRALDGAQRGEPDFFSLPLSAAERLLLCSDGVSGMLEPAELAEILLGTPDPAEAADRLVAAALAAGGRDNATAVVVDVVGSACEDPFDSAARPPAPEPEQGGWV